MFSPGGKNEMNSTRAGILSHAFADAPGQFDVPRGRQGNRSRISRRRAVIMHPQRAIRHTKLRDAQSGNCLGVEIVDAADKRELFIDGHLGQKRIRALRSFRPGQASRLGGGALTEGKGQYEEKTDANEFRLQHRF